MISVLGEFGLVGILGSEWSDRLTEQTEGSMESHVQAAHSRINSAIKC